MVDDFGEEVKVGDWIIHHFPSYTPQKDLICSRITELHGRTTVSTDLLKKTKDYKTKTYSWRGIQTNRFIKVDADFGKAHADFAKYVYGATREEYKRQEED
jgi:hypothetical protein